MTFLDLSGGDEGLLCFPPAAAASSLFVVVGGGGGLPSPAAGEATPRLRFMGDEESKRPSEGDSGDAAALVTLLLLLLAWGLVAPSESVAVGTLARADLRSIFQMILSDRS